MQCWKRFHAVGLASFPGPHPASRRLQYGKAVWQATGSWAGPGNEATVGLHISLNFTIILPQYAFFELDWEYIQSWSITVRYCMVVDPKSSLVLGTCGALDATLQTMNNVLM